jgi:hypothetical protein
MASEQSPETDIKFPDAMAQHDALGGFAADFYRISDNAAHDHDWVNCFADHATVAMGYASAQDIEGPHGTFRCPHLSIQAMQAFC